MDRGAWWATDHRVPKSWTRLKRLSMQARVTRAGRVVRDVENCCVGWAWKAEEDVVLHLMDCKTQNSGLRSKEEIPRDPISQPSRCNTQEGLLTVVQTG